MNDLIDKLRDLPSPRMLLAGDFILDRYVYGDVDRVSPEAPVPVLRTARSESRSGGASNVASAALAMGCSVCCVGIVGQDQAGTGLEELLREAGADVSGLVRAADRPTALKTRFVGLAQHRHAQQMLRVDEESVTPLPQPVHQKVLDVLCQRLGQSDVVILEDYGKGVFTDASTPRMIEAARQASKPVMVDPARNGDYRKYRGATLLKPNRYEASLGSGIEITDEATLAQAARKLQEMTQARAVVISLDRDGMYLQLDSGAGRRIPHQRPRSVYDVTGAGDETMAVLAVALAGGLDYQEAVELANVAGGLEVERFGFVPIPRSELADELRRMMGLRGSKVLGPGQLAAEVARRREQGDVIVFTNGCFDLLHMGHVRYLQQARELGSCLVVAVNSDSSVSRLKGPQRPVISQAERALILASLECVDYVTVFDEDTPMELLELLRPNVLVKGGTTPVIVGRELVESYGGKVLGLELVEGLSTTQIINRILGNHDQGGREQGAIMASKAVFLDRDNTLIEDPGYISDPEAVRLLPGVEQALKSLAQAGYKLVVVTNQSGIARGLLTEQALDRIHDQMRRQLAEKDAYVDAIYYCPYHPEGTVEGYVQDSDLRKPRPGMLLKAAAEMDLDLSQSWMVGDSARDIEAGQRATCRTIRVRIRPIVPKQGEPSDEDVQADYTVRNLVDAAKVILRGSQANSGDPDQLDEGAEPFATPSATPASEAGAGASIAPPVVAAPSGAGAAPEAPARDEPPQAAVPSAPWAARPARQGAVPMLRDPFSPDRDIDSMSDMEIRREMLRHVRRLAGKGRATFSVSKFLAGVLLVPAAAGVVAGAILWRGRPQDAMLCLLTSMALGVVSLTLHVMHRD